MYEVEELKIASTESTITKQIGGILFGIFIGFLITDSIQRGAAYLFHKEAENWGFGFWGNHYTLRVIASFVGTTLGSFVAGAIAKLRGRLCGVLSALPTSIFWVFVGVYIFIEKQNIEIHTANWVVIVLLIFLSPAIGYYVGNFGALIRQQNPEIFESRKNMILGIKWYHWLWLIFIIGWVGVLATYSSFQALWLIFGLGFAGSLHNILGGVVGLLILLSIFYLFMGTYKTFYLLSSGHRLGLSNSRISLSILGWTVGIWIIVGILQYLADVIFSKL